MHNIKDIYVSPMTGVTLVELGGFVCQSIKEMTMTVEVDEIVNSGTQELEFNEDW